DPLAEPFKGGFVLGSPIAAVGPLVSSAAQRAHLGHQVELLLFELLRLVAAHGGTSNGRTWLDSACCATGALRVLTPAPPPPSAYPSCLTGCDALLSPQG